jgi:hypothetical protein
LDKRCRNGKSESVYVGRTFKKNSRLPWTKEKLDAKKRLEKEHGELDSGVKNALKHGVIGSLDVERKD